MDILGLKEYLGMVIDIENNLQAQKNSLTQLQNNLNNCTTELNNLKKKPLAVPRLKEPQKHPYISPVESIFTSIILAAIIYGISFLVFCAINDIIAVPVSVVVAVVVCIYLIFIGFPKKDKKLYAKLENEYQVHINEINISNQNLQSQIHNYEFRVDYIKNQISILTNTISNSEKNLSSLYSHDFIHPKYKKFEYVVLIYECLDTGRCDKLEGPEGAYNRVELDYRLDNISNQLGTIINRLNDINHVLADMKHDLSLLTRSTQSINTNLEKLIQSSDNGNELLQKQNNILKELESKSDLMIYQQERTRREIEYANRINYLMGRNGDGGIFSDNRPPHML